MPLSSIAKIVGWRRDESHVRADRLVRVLERLSDAAELDGDPPLDMTAIRQSAKTSATELHVALTPEALDQYLSALSAPELAMYIQWRKGMSTSEIAKGMRTERKTVVRSLAKIYADLRALHHHQPKEAVSA